MSSRLSIDSRQHPSLTRPDTDLEPHTGDTDLRLFHILLGQPQRVHVSLYTSSTGVLGEERRMLVDRAIVLGRFVGKDLGGLLERVDSYVSHRHVENGYL